jgi:hypothetical protein
VDCCRAQAAVIVVADHQSPIVNNSAIVNPQSRIDRRSSIQNPQ